MNPNKALWEKGDFTRIAETMRESGEAFVAGLGPIEGLDILDLGCGDGTTALPAARRGATVRGVDIAANLVAAGLRRAREAGLDRCSFEEGDASDLVNIANGQFDRVVSVFGAMFAPRPDDVAREMVRVARNGARIVMGNWIPGDPTLVAQILKISAAYAPPPPPGFVSPMTWGDEGVVRGRLEAAGVAARNISMSRAAWTFRHDGDPASFLSLLRRFYGPTMNAFDAAEKDGRTDALHAELLDLCIRCNVSGDAGRTVIPATYLRVEAVVG